MDNELKQQKKQERQTENKYATLINQNLSYVSIFYRICGKAFRICSYYQSNFVRGESYILYSIMFFLNQL